MSYTPEQLHDFWYGPGGSVDDEIIRPGAYVNMNPLEVTALTNTQSAAYDPGFSAILGFVTDSRQCGDSSSALVSIIRREKRQQFLTRALAIFTVCRDFS